jgi:uroporphyrin-III C-methyltransferase
MTLKGKGILELCDVVIYDALVSAEILAMINPAAEKVNAGKRRGNHSMPQSETTQLLIEKAKQHAIVVRLKGGDPFIFGRGGEEMGDLVAAGVSVEVVPGITSGIAAPAYAGIPLTHRDFSSSVTFVTGHESTGKYRSCINWEAIAQGSETIVVYMGLHNLAEIVKSLSKAGLPASTPIALVRQGTRADQSELVGNLGNILELITANRFDPPAIAVIGNVVNLRDSLGKAYLH